ncbi:MAG: VOC family protein [Pseudonocardia sp.]|nr:VOC family protein [Pseudonocardia sp.]MBO0874276.1 VOC family protein [Pseudonocardia sp.]
MALNQNAPTVFPTLRYDDAPSAIKFLTDVLGLSAGEIFYDDAGRVAHAVLGWHNGMVMISSRRDEPSPFDPGRAVLYLVTEEPDALHDRAVAAGAEIVMGLVDQEYGSREFAVRDPENNVWSFGTYQPVPLEPATR